MLWVLIRIGEAILMSTHNICFYGEPTKIIPKLSSNTLLICFTDVGKCINIFIIFLSSREQILQNEVSLR